mmetsp:Transcript_31202/g.64674  ORF Transcript_31202/g.64674 Transcript_31202/m.64674 type:complete len:231 (+) Transcript_31202:685-1377(+)
MPLSIRTPSGQNWNSSSRQSSFSRATMIPTADAHPQRKNNPTVFAICLHPRNNPAAAKMWTLKGTDAAITLCASRAVSLMDSVSFGGETKSKSGSAHNISAIMPTIPKANAHTVLTTMCPPIALQFCSPNNFPVEAISANQKNEKIEATEVEASRIAEKAANSKCPLLAMVASVACSTKTAAPTGIVYTRVEKITLLLGCLSKYSSPGKQQQNERKLQDDRLVTNSSTTS